MVPTRSRSSFARSVLSELSRVALLHGRHPSCLVSVPESPCRPPNVSESWLEHAASDGVDTRDAVSLPRLRKHQSVLSKITWASLWVHLADGLPSLRCSRGLFMVPARHHSAGTCHRSRNPRGLSGSLGHWALRFPPRGVLHRCTLDHVGGIHRSYDTLLFARGWCI